MPSEREVTAIAARHGATTFERLLIVGLGSIGRRHARVVRRLFPGVQVMALRHRGGDGAEAAEVDVVVTDIEQAVAFAPQAAVIASPATVHLASALRLASAGIPLLIEKPIAASAAGVAELLARCAAQRLPVLTGYNLRYLPSLAHFRSRIHEGAVGRVLSVRCEVGQYLPDWRPGADYREAASARAALGGGVLLELSHEFDYLRWIFGEAVSVSAVTSRRSTLEIDVEDTAFVTIGFGVHDGPSGPLFAQVALDFVRRDATRLCTVIGAESSLRWNGIRNSVERYDPAAAAWIGEFAAQAGRDDTYESEWRHFAECVLHGALPGVSGEDGLAAVAIADAARASSATGTTVALTSELRGAA